MQRVIAIMQFVLSGLCALLAFATVVNFGFIVTRPDSISVANVFVGQGLLITILAALSTVLFRRARRNLGGDTGT